MRQTSDGSAGANAPHVGRRSRPVSLLSLKNLNKLKQSQTNIATEETARASATAAKPTAEPAQQNFVQPDQTNNDYYEYLMLSQRHSSSNFIQRVDSSEVVWETKPLPLKMIGTFLLGDKIGKGAFGKVKEGICSETLKRVAVKIIGRKRIRKVQNGVENIIREIKMLRRLRHKNIVTLIEVFAKVENQDSETGIFPWFSTIEEEPIVWLYDDGSEVEKDVKVLKWYLVFEFCSCSLQTMLDLAENNKLDLALSHWFFIQLMEGVLYLHSQGIAHRDIKPGNMLITSDGILKITDFGVAETFDIYSSKPMTSEIFAGTHQFLSPEIAEGASDFDSEKVDVWACGVTLYYMISGKLPFEFDSETNLLDLYDKIIKGDYVIPAEATNHPSLVQLLHCMLEKKPEQRISVSQVLKHDWVLFGKAEMGRGGSKAHRKSIPTYQMGTSLTEEMPGTDKNGVESVGSVGSIGSVGPADNKNSTDAVDMDALHITQPVKSNAKYHAEDEDTHPTKRTDTITPCQTTMIPFLAMMYEAEILSCLNDQGSIVDLAMDE
eukprot:jgi/Hompol1/4925/HPOL_004029-RA